MGRYETPCSCDILHAVEGGDEGVDLGFEGGDVGGGPALLLLVGKLQSGILDVECLFIGLIRVQIADKAGFPEQEADGIDRVELLAHGFIGIDREIGRNERQFGIGINRFA